VDRSTKTVADLLCYWLDTEIVHNHRETTILRYRNTIYKHLIPGLGAMPLQKLTPAQVQKFYADKLASGTGQRSVVFCHQRLHQALDKALRLALVARNVCDAVAPPKYEHTPKETWSRAELARFLEVAAGSRYGPIWLLLALTGMRRGEALGLRWQDIDFENRTMNISQTYVSLNSKMSASSPKTRAGRRVITLEPVLIDALRDHRARQNERRLRLGEVWHDHDLVFASEVGTPIMARNLYRQYGELVKKAGVPHISIHGIRHTVATLAIGSGQDVRTLADLLGHSRTSITTDIYAHVMPHRKRELTRAISEIVLSRRDTHDAGADGTAKRSSRA
jgi:integrase